MSDPLKDHCAASVMASPEVTAALAALKDGHAVFASEGNLTVLKKYSSQQQIVMDQLGAGRSLTNLVALTCHGVQSLTSRIAELRKLGVEIEDRTETDQFDRQYKVYFIKAAKKADAVRTLIEGNDAP